MAIGQNTVYLTLQEDGEEMKYLKNINVENGVAYELTTDRSEADVLTVDEVMAYARLLKTQEPEHNFVIMT